VADTPHTDQATSAMLRFERLLDAPVDKVWQYLVDPDLRARWFMAGPTDARVGGSIGLTMDHDRLSDRDVPTPERYRPYIGHSWSGASAARVSRTSGRCMRRRKRGWRRCWRRVAPSVERMFGPVGLRANAAAGRSPAAWQAVAMAGIQRPGMRGPAYGVERARLPRAHHLLLLGAAADDQCLQPQLPAQRQAQRQLAVDAAQYANQRHMPAHSRDRAPLGVFAVVDQLVRAMRHISSQLPGHSSSRNKGRRNVRHNTHP